MNDKLKGILLDNDEGLPKAVLTRAVNNRYGQFFTLETAKQTLDFYITPKGYISVSAVRNTRRPHEALGGQGG